MPPSSPVIAGRRRKRPTAPPHLPLSRPPRSRASTPRNCLAALAAARDVPARRRSPARATWTPSPATATTAAEWSAGIDAATAAAADAACPRCRGRSGPGCRRGRLGGQGRRNLRGAVGRRPAGLRRITGKPALAPEPSELAAGGAAHSRPGSPGLGKAELGRQDHGGCPVALHRDVQPAGRGRRRRPRVARRGPRLRAAATAAAEATAALRPLKGRARPLAEKSVGTADPGATSLAMIFTVDRRPGRSGSRRLRRRQPAGTPS